MYLVQVQTHSGFNIFATLKYGGTTQLHERVEHVNPITQKNGSSAKEYYANGFLKKAPYMLKKISHLPNI